MARTPSLEIARQLEEVIMEEWRMLEADEKAAESRKPSWKVEEAALGNSAAVVKGGGMNLNDNKEK
eukprot:1095870-Prorocentrum_lima.AAC.1